MITNDRDVELPTNKIVNVELDCAAVCGSSADTDVSFCGMLVDADVRIAIRVQL